MVVTRRALVCTLAMLFLTFPPARGSQIASIDLRELPERASLVILGTVLDTRTSQENNAFLEKTPKGAFMAGTCLTTTTLNGMTITLGGDAC